MGKQQHIASPCWFKTYCCEWVFAQVPYNPPSQLTDDGIVFSHDSAICAVLIIAVKESMLVNKTNTLIENNAMNVDQRILSL